MNSEQRARLEDLQQTKRYRVSYRDGIVLDVGQAFPADASGPMVPAAALDAVLQLLRERERDAERYRWLLKNMDDYKKSALIERLFFEMEPDKWNTTIDAALSAPSATEEDDK